MARPFQLHAFEAMRGLVHLEEHYNRDAANCIPQHEIDIAVPEIETIRQLYRCGPKLARQVLGTFAPIGPSQYRRYGLGGASGPYWHHESQHGRRPYRLLSVFRAHEILSSIFRALAGSAFGRTRCNTPSLSVASILSRSIASESVNTRS